VIKGLQTQRTCLKASWAPMNHQPAHAAPPLHLAHAGTAISRRPTQSRRRPRRIRTLHAVPVPAPVLVRHARLPVPARRRLSYGARHSCCPVGSSTEPSCATTEPHTARARERPLPNSRCTARRGHGRPSPLAPAGRKEVAPASLTTSGDFSLERGVAFPRNAGATRSTFTELTVVRNKPVDHFLPAVFILIGVVGSVRM
jgi:hypothetical protein